MPGLFDVVVVRPEWCTGKQDLEKLPLVARWCRMLHDVSLVTHAAFFEASSTALARDAMSRFCLTHTSFSKGKRADALHRTLLKAVPLVLSIPRCLACGVTACLQLRTVCYNLLGLACKQGALYLSIPASKVADVVVGGIFGGLDYIENR